MKIFHMLHFFYINIILLIVYNCEVLGKDTSGLDKQSNLDDWFPELYSLYKDALENDKELSTRRFNKNDIEYTLHVQKLKEVNGLKTHNLKVEEKTALRNEPIVYINNPVEASMPTAYMTINQFKDSLLERIYKQKQEFEKGRKYDAIKFVKNANKKWKKIKTFKVFKNNLKMDAKGNSKKYKMPPTRTTQTTTKLTTNNLNGAHVNFNNNINNKLNQNNDISSGESGITETTTDDSITETIFTDSLSSDNLLFNLTEVSNSLADNTDYTLFKVKNAETTLGPNESFTETNTDTEDTTTETIIAETETNYETETTTEASTKATRRTNSRPFVFVGDS